MNVNFVGKLLTGDVSTKNLSGPVGIAQGAGNSASSGVRSFLSFLALISVSLGFLNLLPVPVLDGGHLLFYLVELVRGKPVPEAIQEVGMKIGILLILTLTIVALFNDVSKFG
jgi:regulator of sigma E protease